MDLKRFFAIDIDFNKKRWEFHPGDYVNSNRYSVSFREAPTEDDAWKTLNLALQKSPDFFFNEINFINIRKDLLV
jgi:hypothetical protein